MLLTYNDCISRFGSDYKLKKAISSQKIFKLDKGLYSDKKYRVEKEIIAKKYPDVVFTGESAYYYHGLTDVIPEQYTIASRRTQTRIKESGIHQTFVLDDLFYLGISTIETNGTAIKIYDLERMLIELIRFKSKYPFDYYKEIINNYRNRVNTLDFDKLENYASHFKNSEKIMNTIQLEVL